MDKEKYLNMQRKQYEDDAGRWSLTNRDPVVGSYDAHNQWADYDTLLFKDFDTTGLVAMEYGCGPGRNLVKFSSRFSRIDGVDLAQNNLNAAAVNLAHNGIALPNLYKNDGSTMPMIDDGTYDVVFSVICLQHIASYDVRFSILSEIYRVLKPGGRLCFQIGFGGRPAPHKCTPYYENGFDAAGTNGWHDVAVESEDQLKGDLVDKIGFKDYKSDIGATGPGDQHRQWIWVQVEK
jgi:ubiquinone/menaquinone biosynthesis C-methylase UbiE